jgi:hypothetical protein
MCIIAFIDDADVIERILRHQVTGAPTAAVQLQ